MRPRPRSRRPVDAASRPSARALRAGATAFVAALALAGGRSAARADVAPPPPAAVEHARTGDRDYKEGAYRAAAAEYQQAFKIFPTPHLLYNEAQSLRMAGDCGGAVPIYQQYISLAPPNDLFIEKARENALHCLSAEPQPIASSPAVAPPPPVVPPEPGSGGPEAASAAGAPSAEAGRAAEILPAPAPTSPWYEDAWGDTLAGAGVALLATSGAFYMLGESSASQANGATRLDGYLSAQQQAASQRTLGVVCLAGGGALVAAGVVRYLLRPSPASTSERVAVSAAPAPGGGAVVLGGRF